MKCTIDWMGTVVAWLGLSSLIAVVLFVLTASAASLFHWLQCCCVKLFFWWFYQFDAVYQIWLPKKFDSAFSFSVFLLPSECFYSSFLSYLSLLSALSSSISFLDRFYSWKHRRLLNSTTYCRMPPILLPLLYTLSIISSGLIMLVCLNRSQVIIQLVFFSHKRSFLPSFHLIRCFFPLLFLLDFYLLFESS